MPRLPAASQFSVSADSMPLFRPEAIADRQKQYREVLRIRPLSIPVLVLICLVVSMAAILLGLLIGMNYIPEHISAEVHSQRAMSSMRVSPARPSLCVREIANRAKLT
jgi:hypothetical protein